MKFFELNLILTAYEFYLYEKKSGNTLKKLNDNTNQTSEEMGDNKLKNCWIKTKTFLTYIFDTPQYELIQNLLSMINLLFIAINDFLTTKEANYMMTWMIIMIWINNIFLLELIIDFVFFGIKKAF